MTVMNIIRKTTVPEKQPRNPHSVLAQKKFFNSVHSAFLISSLEFLIKKAPIIIPHKNNENNIIVSQSRFNGLNLFAFITTPFLNIPFILLRF